jgi:peptide deformylase
MTRATALAPLLLAACASTGTPVSPLAAEELRLVRDEAALSIRVRGGPGSAVLRARAHEVPEGEALRSLAARMERTMRAAKGVGLAGPQVGVPLRVAALLLDYRTPRPYPLFVVNPAIVSRSDDVIESYEGCLSVPGVGGRVLRSRWIEVRYRDLEGARRTGRFEGANAILWQHELDHLDGVLYLDRLQGELLSSEEMRRQRDAANSRPRQ